MVNAPDTTTVDRAMTSLESPRRGGRRPGAGRKPGPHGPREPHTVYLTPRVWRWLTSAGQGGAGAALDTLVRLHPLFRAWDAKEPPDA